MARYGRVFGLDRETHSVAVYLEHTGTATAGQKALQFIVSHGVHLRFGRALTRSKATKDSAPVSEGSPDHHHLITEHLILTTRPTREQHSSGVEFSGRSCAGINEVNFKGMAESVSPHHKQLTFDSAFCQVALLDTKIIEVVGASPGEQSISATLGEVRHHPA